MPEAMRADLCVIGAGSGGLTVAAGASQMGAGVVLIESDKMGGDCLNYGCVPSKALLAAANAFEARKSGKAIEVLRWRLDENDRAQTERQTKGADQGRHNQAG